MTRSLSRHVSDLDDFLMDCKLICSHNEAAQPPLSAEESKLSSLDKGLQGTREELIKYQEEDHELLLLRNKIGLPGDDHS